MTNAWDLFTWFNAVVLAGSALIIFGFFLRDAKGILIGQAYDDDSDQVDVLRDTDPEVFPGVSAANLEGLDRS